MTEYRWDDDLEDGLEYRWDDEEDTEDYQEQARHAVIGSALPSGSALPAPLALGSSPAPVRVSKDPRIQRIWELANDNQARAELWRPAFEAEERYRQAEILRGRKEHADDWDINRGFISEIHNTCALAHGGLGLAKRMLGDRVGSFESFCKYQSATDAASMYEQRVDKFFSTDYESGAFGSEDNLASWAITKTGEQIPLMVGGFIFGALIYAILVFWRGRRDGHPSCED